MNKPKALLVTRDSSLVGVVGRAVSSSWGFELQVVADIETASDEILGHDEILVTLAHLDGRASVAGAMRLLQVAGQSRRPVVVIVIFEQASPEQALALTRLGVAECLSRPLDLGRLAYLIDALTIEARYAQRPAPAPQPVSGEVLTLGHDPPFLFVANTRMGRMVEQIKRIAPLETSVMLGGETGTGKTHLAGVIHRLSPRREQPFLTINCGALATNLVESEMFGHVRGAFTGADTERTGKFAAVGRGTLFLDEVDSLSPDLQAKLLRVVEDRAFEPVGSNKTMRLRARLIVASNRPLEQEVATGRFRADLFYRFNVVAFEIPPLRERAALIPALVRTHLAGFAARNGRRIDTISPEAMQALIAHSWPGNIRELRNVVERAVALCPGEVIGLDDLPEHLHGTGCTPAAIPSLEPASTPPNLATSTTTGRLAPATAPLGGEVPSSAIATIPTTTSVAAPPLDEALLPVARSSLAESKDRAERSLITEALRRNGQNRLRAAAELGISRMTLYKKLHKYGLMGA